MRNTTRLRWRLQRSLEAVRRVGLAAVMASLGALAASPVAPATAAPAGLDWSIATNPANGIRLNAVTYGNGTFIAVGENKVILSSANGVDWTAVQQGGFSDPIYEGVTYGGGMFVIVGRSGVLLTSADGTSWTTQTSGTTENLADVAYNGSRYVAVGTNGAITTSADGATWSTSGTSKPNSSDQLQSIVADASGNFATVGFTSSGAFAVAWSSPDGLAWTAQSTTGKQLNGVTYGGSKFLAVGSDASNPAPVATSPSGTVWTFNPTSASHYLLAVAFGDGRYVATSVTDAFTSTDGATWTTATTSPNARLYGIAYGAGKFVGVGQSGKIRYSGATTTGPLEFTSGAFPTTSVGATSGLTVTVSNPGTGGVTPSAIAATGSGVSITGGTCAVATEIASNDSCTVVLAWIPPSSGSLSGALTIAYPNGTASSDSLSLSGSTPAADGGGGTAPGPVATPTPTPTPTTTPTPTPTPTASVNPLSPVGLPSQGVPGITGTGLQQGASLMLVDGRPVSMKVEPDRGTDPTGLTLTSTGFRMWIAGRGDLTDPLGLTPKNALILQSEQGIATRVKKVDPIAEVTASGFKPGTDVELWILPTTYVGKLPVGANGSFTGKVPIPRDLALGGSTLQANGFTPDDVVRSVSLGIDIVGKQPEVTKASAATFFAEGSAQLSSSAKASLDRFVRSLPRTARFVRVSVTGFVQPTSFTGNDLALSDARAKTVSAYLKAKGLKGAYVVSGKGRANLQGAAARRVVTAVAYTPVP